VGIRFFRVSFSINLAASTPSGGADTLYETAWNQMSFSKSISPQSTRRSQRLFTIFFLGGLCELCGELLCFRFDQTGSFFGQRLG
jgi:hypothetical protein